MMMLWLCFDDEHGKTMTMMMTMLTTTTMMLMAVTTTTTTMITKDIIQSYLSYSS